MHHFFPRAVAAPELFRCLHNLAPQAEERRGETPESANSEVVAPAQLRDVVLDGKPGTTS